MGAYFNVQINLRSVTDTARRNTVAAEAGQAVRTAQENCAAVLAEIDRRLSA